MYSVCMCIADLNYTVLHATKVWNIRKTSKNKRKLIGSVDAVVDYVTVLQSLVGAFDVCII